MATYEFHGYRPGVFAMDAHSGACVLDPAFDPRRDRHRFEVSDDERYPDGDRSADEVGGDAGREGIVYDGAGSVVARGQIHIEAIGRFRAPDGTPVAVDRIEIGGVSMGYVPSRPLEPGVTYEFVGMTGVNDVPDVEGREDTRARHADCGQNSVGCFGPGTHVTTAAGEVPVEWLAPGDRVLTRDRGFQPVIWVGHVTARPGPEEGTLPVEIAPGALPCGGPDARLVVSPQHRILLSGWMCELHFGAGEVFAAARHLVGWPGIREISVPPGLAFHQFALERHEIVCAEGAWTESVLAHETGLAALAPGDRARLLARLGAGDGHRQAARPCLKAWEVRLLRPQSAERGVRAA